MVIVVVCIVMLVPLNVRFLSFQISSYMFLSEVQDTRLAVIQETWWDAFRIYREDIMGVY